MSSSFTIFSAALVAALSAALPETPFVPGDPPDNLTPDASAALGYVWVTGSSQDRDNKLLQEVVAMVRVYPVQAQRFDGNSPIDPTPLYDTVDEVQVALGAAWSTGGGDPWYWEVLSVDVDHDAQYVQLEVQGTMWNTAAVGT